MLDRSVSMGVYRATPKLKVSGLKFRSSIGPFWLPHAVPLRRAFGRGIPRVGMKLAQKASEKFTCEVPYLLSAAHECHI